MSDNTYDLREQDAWTKLNHKLLPHVKELLLRWTGRETELRGEELLFINTSRGDKNLGSCRLCTLTGKFIDHAEPTFKGQGVISLYSQLFGVNLAHAVESLNSMALDLDATSENLDDGEKLTPEKKAKQDQSQFAFVQTAAAPLHDENALAPMDVHPQLGMVSKSWEYRTADGGAVAFVVSRFDLGNGKKETRPQAWDAEHNRWVWKFPEGRLPVFNLDVITTKPEATVLVCEGEKAAEAAQSQFPDMVATTSSQGANNAHKSDWSILAGRNVAICPDADEAGMGYALAVIGEALVHGAISIRIKNTLVLGWADGDDLADHIVNANFFDDAKPFDLMFEPNKYEPGVVKAAAGLPSGEYDRRVDRIAKSLGVKKTTFNKLVKTQAIQDLATQPIEEIESDLVVADPKPWHSEVDGLQLFNELCTLIENHVVLKPDQTTALVTWVFYSYVFGGMRVAPMLLFTSASRRCGKSTLMELTSGLVSRPLSTSNISAAAIYRVIEAAHPTLLIDEADTFLAASDEVAGILNSGHTKSNAFVVRIEKDDSGEMKPKKFSTFCPKVIAMIGLPKSEALLDRCVMIHLERAMKGSVIEPMPNDVEAAFNDYRRKLCRWAQDNVDDLNLDYTLLPRGSNDRAQNNWAVLASVAKAIAPNALAAVEVSYASMGGATDAVVEDVRQNLLEAMFDIALLQVKNEGMRQLIQKPAELLSHNACLMLTEKLVLDLNALKHEDWSDYNAGKGLTSNKLGKMLSPFGLKTSRGRLKHDGQKRGYRVGDLIPVWQRYGVAPEFFQVTGDEDAE